MIQSSLGLLIESCINNLEDKIVHHDANDMAVDLNLSAERVSKDYKKLFKRIRDVEYDLGGVYEAQKDQKEPATTEYLIPLLHHIIKRFNSKNKFRIFRRHQDKKKFYE